MPVRTEINENDTAKLEKPFIDLLNSSLYPNELLWLMILAYQKLRSLIASSAHSFVIRESLITVYHNFGLDST